MADDKKRKRLSLGEKVEAVTMLNTGCTAIAVMKKFGIKRRTVTKLKSEGSEILKRAEEEGLALHTKTARPVKFPHVEERVLQFIQLARVAKVPVTQDVIQQRALLARNELLRKEMPMIDKDALKKFTASIGWVQKFVKRHGIISVSLHGQADSAAETVCQIDEPQPQIDVEMDDDEVCITRALPALAEVYSIFQPIQNLAYDCNIPEASSGLRRALRGFVNAIQENNAKSSRQVLITEMFAKGQVSRSAESH